MPFPVLPGGFLIVVPGCMQMAVLKFTLVTVVGQLPEWCSTPLLDWVMLGDLCQLTTNRNDSAHSSSPGHWWVKCSNCIVVCLLESYESHCVAWAGGAHSGPGAPASKVLE